MTDEELVYALRNDVGVSDAATRAAHLAADRIQELLNQQDSIREAALREAAVACDIWPADEWHMHTKSGYIFAAEECQRNILALIGENK